MDSSKNCCPFVTKLCAVTKFGDLTVSDYRSVVLGTCVPDSWHFHTDPDPGIRTSNQRSGSGSCSFRQWPPKLNKNSLLISVFANYYLNVYIYITWKIKKAQEVIKLKKSRFSYYFCLMIEGSGSGSVPLTNRSGSESWRPKNLRIIRPRFINVFKSH